MTRRGKRLTARTADKHALYTLAVQAPDTDARFLSRHFRRLTGRPLRLLREDFCGTAALSCAFVRLHRGNRALGVDLDRATLDWGRRHHLAALRPDQRARVHLVQADVLDVRRPRADMVAAMNFSYSVFKTRSALRAYFANARRSLAEDGVILVDVWGGSQTQVVQEEEREIDGFTYVWDQHDFDPLTYHTICKIHFRFPDGSVLRNAFVYDWRLWTIPELREVMEEVGFRDVHVLWESTDLATGEGNGVFRKVRRGHPDDAWIAYVVARV